MDDVLYSLDGSEFRYSSAEEAAEIYASDGEPVPLEVTVFQGECTFAKPSDLVPYIADELANNACDQHGEFGEDWPNIERKEADELQELVSAVVDKFFQDRNKAPGFGSVNNISEVKVHVDADYNATVSKRPNQVAKE